jgi:hypothetical protein
MPSGEKSAPHRLFSEQHLAVCEPYPLEFLALNSQIHRHTIGDNEAKFLECTRRQPVQISNGAMSAQLFGNWGSFRDKRGSVRGWSTIFAHSDCNG